MLRFLSPEWIEALDDAARGWSAPPAAEFTLVQVVRGADGDEVRYHLVIGGGRLRVRSGGSTAATVTVTQAYDVAAAIAQGTLNVEQALALGRLRVSGEVAVLPRYRRMLTAAGDLFASVRPRTTY